MTAGGMHTKMRGRGCGSDSRRDQGNCNRTFARGSPGIDAETIEAARRLFASDTPGDKLARRLLAIAERERAENQPLRNLLSPLRDAVLFARSQRRPMGIGQDFPRAPACVSIQLGAAYGRERDCVGFWIESDEIAPTDADSPSPCHRIGLALIRLAYAVALVSMTRSKP